jgi:hypothetical protein
MITLKSDRLVSKGYNFHGFFRLSLHSDSPKALRHFQAEYAPFEASLTQPADLDITVAGFRLTPSGAVRAFGRHLLSDDWIYAKEHYKVARWHFALQGLAQARTQLFFDGGPFSLDFLQHYFVEQIMRYKVSQRGCLLVHGGCVARNGVSVLFPGLGHTGKTALALWQVLGGHQFQADDYTFVTARGETYCYPRRLHVSDHMRGACPAALRHLSPRHRLSIKAKKLVYYLTLKYGNLSESVGLTEIIPEAKVEDVARLKAVLVLTSSTGTELEGPRPLREGELVNHVMSINRLEGKPLYSLLLAHHYASSTSSLPEWWQRERDILEQALADTVGHEVFVPRRAPDPAAVLQRMARIAESVLE